MASRFAASMSVRAAAAAMGFAALDARPRQYQQRHQEQASASLFRRHIVACEAHALQPRVSPSLVPVSKTNSAFGEAKRKPSAAVLTDEYEVLSRIGQGSYGEVFSARHRQTGALHAIKSGSSVDARVARSFSREVQALAALDHPHIVGLVAFLTEGQNLYIVQELCSGPDLLDYLAKSPLSREGVPYLPEKQAAAILRQCLEAIVGCHDLGLVHRDVKLDNFVIADDGTVKLIDFGLASEVEGSRETQAAGSADYLAPEAATKKSKPSAAADVWSLGVVLFALLTGESFLPGGVSSIAEARTYLHDPGFAQERLRATPAALAISEPARALLEQLLRYDPSERITAAEALSHPYISCACKDIGVTCKVCGKK